VILLVIHNGIDFQKFYNSEKIFNKNIKKISFIYYDIEFKGVKDILIILERIHKIYDNLDITCFGMTNNVNLPDYIKYTYNPDDEKIRKIYCESDIFICASKEEGFYLTPAEAMACKCAVVTSKVGAVCDYSTHKLNAMHFEPGNLIDMERCVRYLLDNQDELEKISLNGYTTIRNKLNWNDSLKTMKKLMENI
jgi:glycosyltransferase involved in cell wall biosynthesis